MIHIKLHRIYSILQHILAMAIAIRMIAVRRQTWFCVELLRLELLFLYSYLSYFLSFCHAISSHLFSTSFAFQYLLFWLNRRVETWFLDGTILVDGSTYRLLFWYSLSQQNRVYHPNASFINEIFSLCFIISQQISTCKPLFYNWPL